MNKKIAQDYFEIELRSAESLADTVAEEPLNGVYLVARTYQGGRMVLELDAHFARLERSAAALGVQVEVPRRRIRELLADEVRRRSAASRNDVDIRFRVTAVLDDPVRYRVTTEIARDIAPELRRNGVVCAVARDAARTHATVKSTAWMQKRRTLGADSTSGADGAIDRVVYEYLLADHGGHILEGATSNFYAVASGTLYTAGEGVLEGIARRMVLEVAPAIVPVSMTPISMDDVKSGRISEAFISSSTRGIVPIRRIDTARLDAPGAITQSITEAWARRLGEMVTPLL